MTPTTTPAPTCKHLWAGWRYEDRPMASLFECIHCGTTTRPDQ